MKIKIKGRPVDVIDKACLKRKCLRIGRYTHRSPAGYSGVNKWTEEDYSCLTRDNFGCPGGRKKMLYIDLNLADRHELTPFPIIFLKRNPTLLSILCTIIHGETERSGLRENGIKAKKFCHQQIITFENFNDILQEALRRLYGK